MRKLKILRKWRRKSLYKKSLTIFSLVLAVLGCTFLIYVYNCMVIYERNLVDNYIAYLAESGKISKDIDDNLFEISKYEIKNAKISDGLKKIFKNKDLEIKKNIKLSTNENFVYDIKNNDRLISTITLKSKKTYTKMAILTIDEWEVNDIKTYFENGIYNYIITVPENYKVYINNNELDKEDISQYKDVDGLERLTKYIEIDKTKTYEINNLVYEPTIKILDDNNNVVQYNKNENKIEINKEFKEIEKLEDAQKYIKDDFDILKFAENYSLFLTDDLKGSYHGFSTLLPYLIKDSYMYEMAYGWSHQVDITFVSNHYLKNPVFTNEEVKNIIVYNDNAFSAEVYLEKNMVVSGKTKVDVMHDRLYFIYYNGGYKLVDMKSIKG